VNLLRGFPGHPFHPPLTATTIGAYTFATAMAVLSKLGVSEHNTATAWWLAVVAGLVFTIPTAITGFADWLHIEGGTPLWRTATYHLSAMLTGRSCSRSPPEPGTRTTPTARSAVDRLS
jgi:uncharacterized membrane protein